MTARFRSFLKCLLHDRGNLFWTLAFPLIMATFFQLAFAGALASSEALEIIPVAVEDTPDSRLLGDALAAMESGGLPLFHITLASDADAAMALLDSGQVVGVVDARQGAPALTVARDGLAESVLKSTLDAYWQTAATLGGVAAQNPGAVDAALAALAETHTVGRVALGAGSLNNTLRMFYALIAMTCLQNGFAGLNSAMALRADRSPLGLRRSISPLAKWRLALADLLAALALCFGTLCLLLGFMRFVLGVELGAHLPAVLALCLVAGAVGVLLGFAIGAALPGGKGAKEGILISVTLVCSFAAGLMYFDPRPIIEGFAPVLNRINPAVRMVDALYALDTYGVGARYWGNLLGLGIMAAVLAAVAVAVLRRRQYASL